MSKAEMNGHRGPNRGTAIAAVLMLYDLLAIHLSYFLALWLRFDLNYSTIPRKYLYCYTKTITIYALICVAIYWLCKMYKVLWRFASVYELVRTLVASAATSLGYSLVIIFFIRPMPVLYHVFGMLLQFIFLIAARFSFRFYRYLQGQHKRSVGRSGRVMIIGAGRTGQTILHDMNHNREINDRVVCIIDDDAGAWGKFIEGVPIVGGRDEIMSAVKKYRVGKIYLAIPGASVTDRRDILHICSETDCVLKQLPGMYQFVDGDKISVRAMKDVSVEDLLGREPIRTDMQEVFEFFFKNYFSEVVPKELLDFGA